MVLTSVFHIYGFAFSAILALAVPTAIAVLLWIAVYTWKRRNLYLHASKVPGPLPLPLVGSAYIFLGCDTYGITKTILNFYQQYPEIGKLWFGPHLVYLVSKPEYLETIMNSPKAIHKDHFYKILRRVIGNYALMSAQSDVWKIHRKVIVPSLNQTILNSFMDIFLERSKEMCDVVLDKEGHNKDMDLFNIVSTCTLDIICETAMGLRMNLQTSKCDFIDTFNKICEISGNSAFSLLCYNDFIFKKLPIGREFYKEMEKFQEFTGKVVKEKKAKFEKEKAENLLLEAKIEGSRKKMAFLDALLENSDFTEEEIRDEVNLFVVAGADTTANTLTCMMMILGMYPDIQQKVLDEVLSVLGPDRDITPSDLNSFEYTEMVIKETLRILPAGPMFLRGVYENLDLGDVTLPAGSTVFLYPLAIHRNPKYWPNPLEFCPERFLPENEKLRHPCSFIPFSYGPRNCVGIRYAKMLMKTMISTVIRKYEIFCEYKSVEEIKVKTNIVLRLKDGAKVWVKKRN